MSAIRPTDRDFLLSEISFDELVEIQLEAESREWGTRWTSVEALRSQVAEAPLLLKSLLREERNGFVRAYRCLALFSPAGSPPEGPARGADQSSYDDSNAGSDLGSAVATTDAPDEDTSPHAPSQGVTGLVTVDIDPVRYASLRRIDRDPDVRRALNRKFSLALRRGSMVVKQ